MSGKRNKPIKNTKASSPMKSVAEADLLRVTDESDVANSTGFILGKIPPSTPPTIAKITATSYTPSPVLTQQQKGGFRILSQTGGFSFSDMRPRTEIGPQGDHVSAYTLYKELIYASVEGLTVGEATNALHKVVNCLALDEQCVTELQEIWASSADNSKYLFSENEQSLIIQALEYFNTVNSFMLTQGATTSTQSTTTSTQSAANDIEVRKVIRALRLSNRDTYSIVLGKMVDKILSSSNKMKYVSFPAESNMPQKPGEGARILIARNELRSKSDTFSDLQANTNISISADAIDNIARWVTDLFWHPYLENPMKDDEWNIIKDKYNKEAIPRNNNVEILYQVVARHMVLIFNAFEGLHLLDVATKTAIQNNFINNILEEQCWKNAIIAGERQNQKKLDSIALRIGLAKYAVIDFDENKYYQQKPTVIRKALFGSAAVESNNKKFKR